VLGPYWLLCRHLSVLVEAFSIGKIEKTTYYGSYRSELVVNLFHRIVDIHNVEMILRHLEPFEVGCIICRIGRLNLFNPMKPEGGGELNLGLYEDRQVRIVHLDAITSYLSALNSGCKDDFAVVCE
jgi:hypothetical protein